MSTISTNINDSFFDSSYKEAWKKIIPPGLTEAEADFILDVASLEKGDRVLDLMCGYGRHALELGRRDIKVTALDNLREYISEINEQASAKGLDVNALQANAITMNLEGIYDAAICMGNSFAFFDRADAVSILKNVAAHLKPGGIFIINSWMVAEIAIRHFKEHDWHWAGDYKCVLENKYRFHPSRIESEQTIIAPNGKVEVIKGVDYIFTLAELEEMFQQTGFKTKDLFSTPRKRKFNLGDGKIYIVVEKKR
jgi:SAM-dependent methyltransferase